MSEGTFAHFVAQYGFFETMVQSTLVISKSKELSEILRDIRTSTYQICKTEEKNKSNNHILEMNM